MSSEPLANTTLLPLSRLLAMANPLDANPWFTSRPVTAVMVRACQARQQFARQPLSTSSSALRHARRIAWLLTQGWTDPIEVDVGCPSFPGFRAHWPIVDGNHRVAAASLRGDVVIAANVSGEVAYAQRLFGVAI